MKSYVKSTIFLDARTAAFRNISQTNELDYDFFNGLETSYVTDDTDHFEKRPERTKRESNQVFSTQ